MSTPPSSPTRVTRADRNAGTRTPGDLEEWRARVRAEAPAPDVAYRMALAAERARARPADIGLRLYWVTDRVVGDVFVRAEPGAHAIVGRHTRCDLVLGDSDPAVSLRHVLVRAEALDDGMPVLGVLDLASVDGFALSTGERERSIVATGPCVFYVGSNALVALPNVRELPDELAAPHVDRAAANPYGGHARRVELGDGPPPSRITTLPKPVHIEKSVASVAIDLDEVAIAFARGAVVAAVRVPETDLDRGLLLGRSDKCLDGGVRKVLSEGVSRVHALLVRERGELHLYDAASTNGTFCDGNRVRFATIERGRTVVRLSGWHPAIVTFPMSS